MLILSFINNFSTLGVFPELRKIFFDKSRKCEMIVWEEATKKLAVSSLIYQSFIIIIKERIYYDITKKE